MADEIADALYESIKKELERAIGSDKRIQTILKRIAKGTATHKDTQEYALRLGKLTSKALQNNLTEDTLPDENLSYHIANGTVGKTLEDNLSRVNGIGGQVQNLLNDKAGLGLRAVEATLNYERVHDLVSLMDNCDDLPQARELMDEPVINCTQSYADDVVKENAEFQYQAGLSPKIVRTAEAGCCDWCESLAGTYDYPLDDDKIYQRHQYCRCLVTYDPGNGKVQNVYTRDWRDTDGRAKIEERVAYARQEEEKRQIQQLCKLPNTEGISIPAKQIDVNNLGFDSEHFAMTGRNITREEAISYISNALFSADVWGGEYTRYFSEEGATYVNNEKNIIRTAYRRDNFTDNITKSLEVLK